MAPINFIHIGKTGGTAIRHAFRSLASPMVMFHPHSKHLRHFAEDQASGNVFFFTRDPIARFISAFNSRKRQGAPRHYSPLSPELREMYSIFENPNDLAEALSRSEAARSAMSLNGHIRDGLATYLGSTVLLEKMRRRIAFIGKQETLNGDFEKLKLMIGAPSDIKLPTDPVEMHKTPDRMDVFLSEQAKENLRVWYVADYEVLAWCEQYRANAMGVKGKHERSSLTESRVSGISNTEAE